MAAAAIQAKMLQELVVAHREAKVKQRKLDIAGEVGKLENPNSKRNVGFGLGLLHKIEDLEAIFLNEDESEVANVDNLDEVNLAIKEMKKLLGELKSSVLREVDMQTIAATSPLGWKTVQQMEVGSRSFGTCTSEEVRKAEKERMTYEREIQNARQASSRGRGPSRWGPALGASSEKKYQERENDRYQEREDDRTFKRGRGGRGGGGLAAGCFRCGDMSHQVAACKKPYSK